MQSRYYNPEWGRFISADAIAGSVGELLGHNVFAYCKNNVVNMSDPSGFRPLFTADEETDEMREASVEMMHNVAIGKDPYPVNAIKKYETKKKLNSAKQTAIDSYPGLAAGALFSVGESVVAEATLGYGVIPFGRMPIPIKLSTFESIGNFFMATGLFSLTASIEDNFSCKYSNSQAWIRTGVDVGCFAGSIALCGGGGWVPVMIGIAIGVGGESIKWGADVFIFDKKE